MEVTGKIIVILPANSGVSQRTGNPWCTQMFVLETIEQYPKKIPFEVFGEDRIKQFNLQMGETVTIHFDVDGREWNGRWFAKVSCYNVTRAGQAPANAQNTQQPAQAVPVAQPAQQQVQQQPVQQQMFAPAQQPQPQGGDGGNADDLPF